jgi:hypothetical protein
MIRPKAHGRSQYSYALPAAPQMRRQRQPIRSRTYNYDVYVGRTQARFLKLVGNYFKLIEDLLFHSQVPEYYQEYSRK